MYSMKTTLGQEISFPLPKGLLFVHIENVVYFYSSVPFFLLKKNWTAVTFIKTWSIYNKEVRSSSLEAPKILNNAAQNKD